MCGPGRVERRKEPRYPYPSTIEIACESRPVKSGKAITINVSKNGASLYVFDDPAKCSSIKLKSRLPVSSEKAVVLWHKEVENGLYRVGIQFS